MTGWSPRNIPRGTPGGIFAWVGTVLLVVTLATPIAHAGGIEVDRLPDGGISVVSVYAEEGTLIWIAPPEEGRTADVYLTVRSGRAWRITVDPLGADVLFRALGNDDVVAVDSSPLPRAEGRPAARAREITAGLIDAAATRISRLPAPLARVRMLLEPVRPARIHLRSPAGTHVQDSCIGRPTRDECDDCCDDQWHQDRDACRNRFPSAEGKYPDQQRCMLQFAEAHARCSLSCSLLPVKPDPGKP